MDRPKAAVDGKLQVGLLKGLGTRPKVFEAGEPLFWDDPHISSEMLRAHLDPKVDAASRRPETIDTTVAWLVDHLGLEPGDSVLDLGCGPGLYCTRLHQRRLRVTGMDYSHRSLDYARAAAAQSGRDIGYVYQNYLTLDLFEQFDAIFLIYCDFAVLAPSDRDDLLGRVRRALKPGGRFAFDVFTPANRPATETSSWVARERGFWRPDPYLCLENTFYYPEEQVFLDQYVVVGEDLSVKVYRNWDQVYTPEAIMPVLEAQGFRDAEFWGDLAGAPYNPDAPCLGIICR